MYNYEIGYNLAFYDHLPVFLTIETCITREQNNINEELIYKLVDWRNFDINEYCDIAERVLGQLAFGLLACGQLACGYLIGMEDNWHAENWHGGQLALIFKIIMVFLI